MINKKIWYVSKYSVSPKYGRASRQFLYSKYFVKYGFETSLITSCSAGDIMYPNFKGLFLKDTIDDVKCFLLRGPKIRHGFNFKRIFSWIIFELNLFRFFIKSKNKPDIVIVSSLSLLTILNGIYFKKKYGVKFILEIRDIWPLTLIDVGGFSRKNIFVKALSWIEKTGYKEADIIVGSMSNLKEHVENTINEPFEFAYLPMGLDLLDYSTKNKKWVLPKDKFIVGYAGSIGLVNQIGDILNAAQILKDNKNILFVFLGDGPLKTKFIDMYNHLNNVLWFPKVEKKFVNSFLEECDILVHPCRNLSIYKFGVSPNKWIDYMYSSKPIIVSYSGYPSIINEAECGEFIEAECPEILSQKILEYSAKEKYELEKMGQNGKNYLINNLSYDSLSKKYIELFK